ncbi:hypothetical protein GF420_16305 [candidate division GN15 bacterium]|nr:hypothetical protein [candidate division GN15 bacterium]
MLTHEEIEQVRMRLEETVKGRIKPRRIRAIDVNSSQHWQPPLHIEVGRRCAHLEKDAPVEEVLAIFESTAFMVCTQSRGVDTPLPYYFSREDVRRVVYADEPAD